ncbi:MAG: peptidase M14 [Gammaproteobacteria bacterium]|nr:MAG: peptidase M14 [Gammaproteobacteria bacterium]
MRCSTSAEPLSLRQLDHCPPALYEAEAGELRRLLGGPTLLHLPGRRPAPLFVSVLLHGNETTGYLAVRELLRRYRDRPLPRALSVFFGNVYAAEQGVRRLPDQPDYNRVWPGSETAGTPEHAMMAEVVQAMESRGVFAAVDVHNNTGINPHYACVNRIDHRFLHLAILFSRTVVYFVRPRGVASMALARLCPSVTVECGQPGQRHGIEHALEYLEACLHLAEIPVHPVAPHDLDLYHTVASIRVPERVAFGFGRRDVALEFQPDLDHLNFRELPAGTVLARLHAELPRPLVVTDERGRDVFDTYFAVEDDQLVLKRPVMPSMFTLDARIVRQDCLGYLMERIELVSDSAA